MTPTTICIVLAILVSLWPISFTAVHSKRSSKDVPSNRTSQVLSSGVAALTSNATDRKDDEDVEPLPHPRGDRILGPVAPFPWEGVILSLAAIALVVIAATIGRTLMQKNKKEPFTEPIFSVI